MEGLSRLFGHLFGVSFRVVQAEPDELLWHDSVRKVEFVDEVEGVLGVMYCDLFARQGKPPAAAHYTVRCARRTDDDQAENDFLYSDAVQIHPETARNTIVPGSTSRRGKEGRWQLPIIVLSCDFERPESLSWHEVETLFHEMGHALHCRWFPREKSIV